MIHISNHDEIYTDFLYYSRESLLSKVKL